MKLARLFQGLGIMSGALVLTTVGIFASDTLRGVTGGIGMVGSVSHSGSCVPGTVLVNGPRGHICADLYEASVAGNCMSTDPKSVVDTERNLNTPSCYAASLSGKQPWTFVTLPQAERLCAQSGKRLPYSDEWYALALGTQEVSCTVSGTLPEPTGAHACVSTHGVHDMIGNVWEWVQETVSESTLDGRLLPQEGYVTQVDGDGVAISTRETEADELYGSDYFWSKEGGPWGMLRGGFYGSGKDAGLYTINAAVPTNFATQGVGFRCVEDVL